jgi:hypothetical protein
MDVILELLQSLGNTSKLGEGEETTWATLGSILSKCLDICDGTIPAACTLALEPHRVPRLSQLNHQT